MRKEKGMARRKVSGNAPCPCGSGKKYKKCCWGQGFDWEEGEGGHLYRSTPLSPEVADILQAQRQKFMDRYGREPGPHDPVFFDLPPLEQVEHQAVEAMKAAGLDLASLHAFEKTGRLVTEQNRHLLPQSALDEWQAAVEEYEARHGTKGPPQYPSAPWPCTAPTTGPRPRSPPGSSHTRTPSRSSSAGWARTRWSAPRCNRSCGSSSTGMGSKEVALSQDNLGCPHEEGEDCPFWKGKQGGNRRD